MVSERVDLATSGAPGDPNNGYYGGSASISGDGRFVAFEHMAEGLVPGDDNLASDVFLRDTVKGTTEIVSGSAAGLPVLGNPAAWGSRFPGTARGLPLAYDYHWVSFDPSLSANGRFIAFTSIADTLVAGDTNLAADVFVYDRKTAKLQRESVNSDGSQASTTAVNRRDAKVRGSFLPSISADGRYVSFTSDADNLVATDTNGIPDVFVRDRKKRQTIRVSVATGGKESQPCEGGLPSPVPEPGCPRGVMTSADYPSSSISGNGRIVAFDSAAGDLVEDDRNGQWDVFAHDLGSKKTSAVSSGSDGSPAERSPCIPTLVTKTGSALADLNDAYAPVARAVSRDGRHVTFTSHAPNLVPNSGRVCMRNVFVKDRKSQRTERISVQYDGRETTTQTGGGYATTPAISGAGRHVVFHFFYTQQSYPSAYDRDHKDDSFLAIYDRTTGSVNVPEPAEPPDVWDAFPDISATGRYTVNLTWNRVSAAGDAFFRRDRGTAN